VLCRSCFQKAQTGQQVQSVSPAPQ
jgi:hypothetical protein